MPSKGLPASATALAVAVLLKTWRNLNVHSLLILKRGRVKKSAKGKIGEEVEKLERFLTPDHTTIQSLSQVSCHRKH